MMLRSTEYADVRGSWQELRSQDAGPSRLGVNRDAGAMTILSVCGAFEWLTFFYLTLVNTLLFAFQRNLASAWVYILIHQSIAVGIIALSYAAVRWPSRSLRFLRHWYPLPLYIYFFEELRGLVHLIFPGWFDAWLIRFDYSLVHVHPSLWLTRFASAPLNDFMQGCYMTYFIYLVALPAILYFRRETRAFWTVMTATAIAHYSVYVISILFPIESPHFALAAVQPHLEGGASTALINLIERFGRVHGAAFPSAHVAGSMVAILASLALSAMAFLAVFAIFRGDDDRDSLRRLSLRRGCAGGNVGGRNRLGSRQLDHAASGFSSAGMPAGILRLELSARVAIVRGAYS